MNKQEKQTKTTYRCRQRYGSCQSEGVWAAVVGKGGQLYSDGGDLTCGGRTMQYTDHVP